MAEEKKDFYVHKPVDGKFQVTSGAKDFTGTPMEYSIVTDSSQGLHYSANGNKFDNCNASSIELCGLNCDKEGFGKTLKALNGNILIECLNGEIVLKANSIRLLARDGKGEITLVANSQIASKAPIVNEKGTISNSFMTNSKSISANAVDTVGGVQNSSGVTTDLLKGTFLGQIMQILDKFKKFLECAG